jgi:hypothetical protein
LDAAPSFTCHNNDPSMRLYVRLGFVPIQEIPAYIEMEWKTR